MIDRYTIICPIHGDYKQTLHKHLQGDGCKECGLLYRSSMMKENSKNEFIEKAIKKHGNRYDYSKSIYTKAIEPIKIICNLHGEFTTNPNKHLEGAGCKKCGFNNISKALIYPLNKFLEEVNIIHNNKYDYSKVVWKGIDKTINVICKRHGDFLIRALDHKKRGCFKCYKEDNTNKKLLPNEEFIKRHKEVHGNTYIYKDTLYKGFNKKVNVTCKIHGEYWFLPSNMSGCKKCMMKKHTKKEDLILTKNNKDLNIKCKNEFISKAIVIHGSIYDYSKVDYIRSTEKVIISCLQHGDFLCSPNNHLNGKGCSKCSNLYSKKSIRWLKYKSITQNCYIQHIENEGEYTIPKTRYKADGYCKNTNTIYEFNGTEYHGDPRVTDHSKNNHIGLNYGDLYLKTITKENIIKQQGFNLITIWEKDWNIIENLNKSIRNHFIRKNKIVRKRIGNIIIKYVG